MLPFIAVKSGIYVYIDVFLRGRVRAHTCLEML